MTENSSQYALRNLWDFCPETFTEAPLISETTNVPGLANGWGYKVLKDGNQWIGFLLSRNTNKLFRLEFGSDPLSQPTVFDLGNPGNLLVSPQGLDVVKQNGYWYGFVGKGETTTGQIVRLDFGSSLHNTPTAVGLGVFGSTGSRIRDLSVVKQGDDWILLMVMESANALLRINYRDSFSNNVSAENISTTGSLPGASLLLGFSVIRFQGNWIVHTASFLNNGIQRYNFGDNILGTPSFEGNFTFSSVARPYYIKVIREAGSFYGFVGNESKNVAIIKFGNFTSSPEELPNSSLPRFIGFDVLKSQSKNILQGSVTGTSSFRQAIFENSNCGSQKTWTDEEVPSNVSYNVPGTYAIELLIEGEDSQFDVASKTINVSSFYAPTITIERDHVCVDSPITFLANSGTELIDWKWDFGDNVFSTESSPGHQYNVSGDYTVTVDARDVNNCRNITQSLISIYPSPDPFFTLPVSPICTNNEFLFRTTTPDMYDGHLSYQWYVDGGAISTDRDLKYTFTTTGPKDIKLKTSIPGCSSEITKSTSSVQAGPVVDFSYSGMCEGDEFSFQGQIKDPVESYQWQFGASDTSIDPNPNYYFSGFGSYSVSLTATNEAGCENVKVKTITVASRPLVAFNADGPPNTCSGTQTAFQNLTTTSDNSFITNWEWNFDDPYDVSSGFDEHSQHIFNDPGTYSITLTATSEFGCSAEKTKEIVILESPSADFSHSAACDELPVTFSTSSGQSIAHFYWEIGTSYYYDPAPTHTFKSPGDYPVYLEVIGTNGCIAETNTTVHVPVPLTPEFSVMKNCVDQQAVFTDITTGLDPVATRSWNFNPGGHFTGQEVGVTFQQQGEISATLLVTGESGCSYKTTRPVVVLAAPHASFDATPTTGGYPLEVQFSNESSGATHYLWSFQNETSSEVSPVHTFREAGDFDVTLTAFNEQECEHSATSVITSLAPLPDADIDLITLSPNNDGTYRLIVTIHNKGNTFLRDVPVDIDFGGSLQLREVVQETIAPSSKYNLVLATSILRPDILQYLCVSMEIFNDGNASGNRKCVQLENDLYVFNAFPNPVSEQLTVEWISHASHMLHISIVDAMGREILTSHPDSTVGLNRQIFDVGAMENGIYYLLIDDGSTHHRQRIIVSNNR